MSKSPSEKGWKIVPVRVALWNKLAKRASDEDRSVASVVERILTGAAKPEKMEATA